ncbi:LuxR C-terminal-related transcriptional regulator [Rhodococcus kronopolitis]|uniref:LuxR C-terminal-related transcriptional regulator n=1 Tax=Rhodococcus kronopolitis TaxID=1460226 RepID=A0ABV9FW31_9NOCA
MSVTSWDTRRLRTCPPSYAAPVIRRQRLLDSLSDLTLQTERSTGAVVLLSAPVGSGKTMLLSDWAAELACRSDSPAVAWLTVDETDNDPIALRASMHVALENSSDAALADAVRPLPPVTDDRYADELSRMLGTRNNPVVMVLDDAHLLHEPAAIDTVNEILRWAPASLRTVVAGRFEPPLAVHRMRLDGRVHDFAPDDLAFTTEETATLLDEHEVRLDTSELAMIHDRTEGWAAGLRLAAISLARHSDPASMIADFNGDNRIVADYLVNEVLDGLPERVCRFVVETSIPDQFTAELAEDLTGNIDSRTVLDSLERSNFLLERVAGSPGWYRYHPLLREYLRAEVGRLGQRAVADLEQTSALWFGRAGDYLPALEHALHTGDDDALLALLDERGLHLVLTGHGEAVIGVLDRASLVVRSAPAVRLLRAAAELARGNDAAATSHLGTADGRTTDHTDLTVLEDTLRLQLAVRTGGISEALETLQSAPVGATGNPELDAFSRIQQGLAELHLGRTGAADRHLADALADARSADLPAVVLQALVAQATVAADRCRITRMSELAGQAMAFGRAHDLTGAAAFHVAQLLAAWGHYLRVEEEPMRRLAGESIPALAAGTDPTTMRIAACLAALFDFESADDPHALARVLREHTAPDPDRPRPPYVTALLVPSVQRAFLRVGEVGWATRLAEVTAHELGDVGELAVLGASAALHHRRADAAQRELAPVLSGDLECTAVTTLVRAWLIAACLADDRNDPIGARAALLEALTIAEPDGLLRPFRDAGEQVRTLLERHHGRFGVLDGFAAAARSAIPQAVGPRSGLLTPREMELLRELPSWRTADQIAADLFVSVNTVKTHLRGVYRKLDVRTRRDAITAARALGLL